MFITYCFNKLQFGISSAPKIFQKRMSKLLEGVVCHMDDIPVVGVDQEQHNARLTKVFERIESAKLTLNGAKYDFWATA